MRAKRRIDFVDVRFLEIRNTHTQVSQQFCYLEGRVGMRDAKYFCSRDNLPSCLLYTSPSPRDRG